MKQPSKVSADRLASKLAASMKLRSQIPTLRMPTIGERFARIGASVGRIPRFDLPSGLSALVEGQSAWSKMRSVQSELLAQYEPLFSRISKVLALERRLSRAGWLPHESLPWEEIDLAGDGDLAPVLERHYRTAWPQVRSAFEERLGTYAIDEEAKSTFREALAAHEAGLYRTSARTLFPEIERVSRLELHGGNAKSFASQKELQEWAGELFPADVVPDGQGGMELFRRLIEHLYVEVKQPEALAAVAADPVPNRHAALHGLVSYPTMQNSINALIMTDFIFRVICAVKRDRARTAEPTAG